MNPLRAPLRITWERTVTERYSRTVEQYDLPSNIEDAWLNGENLNGLASFEDWVIDEEAEGEPDSVTVDSRTVPDIMPLVRGVCLTCDWATDFYPTDRIVDAMMEHHMASTHGAKS